MKWMCQALVFMLCVSALSPLKSLSSTPPDQGRSTKFSSTVSDNLEYVEDELLSVAEAMPEEKYSFIPTAGKFDDARSFAEQIKHVACAQFAFFNEFESKQPPADCEKGGHEPAKTKAELIAYLESSYAYANRVLATLTPQNALDPVEGRYAGPNTNWESPW